MKLRDLRHRYCIVGVGNTAYGKCPGMSPVELNTVAIRAALDDAGLEATELDGVLTKAPTSSFSMLFAPRVAQALGIRPAVVATLDQAGASNIGLVQYAISCIELGQASVVAIAYGDNPRTGARQSYGRANEIAGEAALAGLFGAPTAYALVAQRYLHERKATQDDLAAVAIAHRAHAALNEAAERRAPLTRDEYDAEPWIAEPFRSADCCPVSDGGAAFIVTTLERARALRATPVFIEGIGQAHPSWDFFRRPDLLDNCAGRSGHQAMESAGIGRDDVDFCQLYDCFSVVPLITLEAYGFAEPGKSGAIYRDGGFSLSGAMPCNTAGGLLAETGLPGTQLCLEAVRQLRHACGARQVANAEVGLVSQQGGVMTTHATMILSNRETWS